MTTTKDIKDLAAAGNSDWEILAMMINRGAEYPDAVYKISAALRMDDAETDAMQDAYDNNI